MRTMYIILIFLVVTGLWAVGFLFDKQSQEGIFSIIGTLFSGLAFAGVIVTIVIQFQELKLQREELTETRKELKRSADAQEKTSILNALTAACNYHTQTGYANQNQGNKIGIQSRIKAANLAVEIEKIIER